MTENIPNSNGSYRGPYLKRLPRGRILGWNPDKNLNSFPPCYSQSYLQLGLEISISSNSCSLLRISTIKLLYTGKEKGGKPDRKPYPFPYVLRNLQFWELLRLCPETSTKLYVHEFGFWSGGSDYHYACLKWCQCTRGISLQTNAIQLFYIAIFSEELDFIGKSEVTCRRIHRSLTWLAGRYDPSVRDLWILS